MDISSLKNTVPLGRLHMRPFQWYLKSHWKFPQSLDKRIPVTELSNRSKMVGRSTESYGGHGGRVETLSPPISEAGVQFTALPKVGKLVVACH